MHLGASIKIPSNDRNATRFIARRALQSVLRSDANTGLSSERLRARARIRPAWQLRQVDQFCAYHTIERFGEKPNDSLPHGVIDRDLVMRLPCIADDFLKRCAFAKGSRAGYAQKLQDHICIGRKGC